MSELIKLLRKGNKSAMMAAIVNTIISIIKGIAFALTGNVAMFAETMHSLGTQQISSLFYRFSIKQKAPTKRFPNGFGRLVNLVLLGAVLVVGIMAFETIKEGYHHILHPTKSSGFILNIAVLGISVLLEMFVLFKAMKEILHDVGMNTAEVNVFTQSFVHLKKAKPATKLVLWKIW